MLNKFYFMFECLIRKNYRMLLSTFLFLLILLIELLYLKLLKVNYIPNSYELEAISYFKEIALKTELNTSSNHVLKWEQPMCIYIVNANKNQIEAVKNAINSINLILSNTFKVELVYDQKKCNTILYFCSMESIKNLDYSFYKMFANNIDYEVNGYAFIKWNNYVINKATIHINPINSLDVQKSTVLEEITQCIGLPNDSLKYPNSVFYENKSDEDIIIKEFSALDKDIIQLLYNPNVKAGMNSEQVENKILKILKNKEVKLYGIQENILI